MKYAKPKSTLRLIIHSFLGISFALCLVACQGDEFKLKKALNSFDKGEYELVIQQLKPLAEKGYQLDQTTYFIAESYRLSNRISSALPYYQTALAKGNTDNTIRFNLAFAAKATGNYALAQTTLKDFLQNKPSKSLKLKAEIELENLPQVSELQKKSSPVGVQAIQGNTPMAEFSARKLGDELIITSSRKQSIYKNNGLPYLGLYKASLKSPVEIGSLNLFSPMIDKENANEGTPAFSKDGNTVVFARGNTGKNKDLSPDVDLYISRRNGNDWSLPERLAISDSIAWDGSPAFSSDGKTLYFSSNRRGGKGGLDIYRSPMDNSGRFGRPINLGSAINTPGDEIFPFVSEDGKLYFSSDGHPSLGGLDLFVASRNENEIVIEHLGVPMNSISDDFGISLVDSVSGYFSSNRAGGKGDDDIYYFKSPSINPERWWTNEAPPVVAATENKIVQYFLQTEIIDPSGKPIDSVKVSIRRNGQSIDPSYSNKKGRLEILDLAENDQIDFVCEKEDYLTKRSTFSMEGREIPARLLKKEITDTTFVWQIVMDKAEVGKEITQLYQINPIYYNLDRSEIRNDASEELEKIVQFLRDNTNVSIELGSHTDSRGSVPYNQKLSQRRAESAVRYIVQRGIDQKRIKAKGYGESQLVNECADGVECSEEMHQQNRRTEFKITEIKAE